MVLLLGASGVAGMGALVYLGVQSTTALNSILLQASMPPVVLLLGWAVLRDKTSLGQAAGVGLSLLGVVEIITTGRPWNQLHMTLNPGDALILTGVVLYSGYSLLLRFRPKVHPLSLLWATFAVALLTITPFYGAELMSGRGFALGFKAVWGIGFVALFPSVLAYLCYNRGVELIGAGRASQFMHLMPIFGAVLAVGLLGESFHLYHAVGVALIAAGILVATLAVRAQARAAIAAARG
jgi:drug/metabolite transporter (DMT)-like permease